MRQRTTDNAVPELMPRIHQSQRVMDDQTLVADELFRNRNKYEIRNRLAKLGYSIKAKYNMHRPAPRYIIIRVQAFVLSHPHLS